MTQLFNRTLLLAFFLLTQSAWATPSEQTAKVKIAFILEHLLVRGTEVATFDYADYNESLLGNESYIIFLNNEYIQPFLRNDHTSEVEELFVNRFGADHFFECKNVESVNQVLTNENIDMVYWQANGAHDDRISQLCKKTAIHAVFGFEPQGNAFGTISKYLSTKDPRYSGIHDVSYIVRPPQDFSNTMHDQLQIPKDAIVFGRHGGYGQLDIGFAKEAVIELAQKHKDWYFLFLNTEKFCEFPNVVYLEKTWDYKTKERFINTCDAMLHARSDGETFGLACAEFSVRNKPIITCITGDLAHFAILGEKALRYTNKEQLIDHLEYCAAHRDEFRLMDWDAYSKDYNPEVIMKKFNEVFVLPLTQ